MKRFHLLSIFCLTAAIWATCCCSLLSQPTAEEKSSSQPHTEPNAELSKLRDPFWPVGWRPSTFGGKNEESENMDKLADWGRALSQLKIGGLSKKPDGSYLAVIRGAGIVEKGDIVAIRYNSLVYRWRITDITSEGIVPEQIDIITNH